jgi:hypothetical protein
LAFEEQVQVKSEMSKKLGDFFFRQLSRIPFTVENNEALHPADLSVLGANTVMFTADGIPHLVEQFWVAPGPAFSLDCPP